MVIDLKAVIGTAYFSDGHYEKIYCCDVHSNDHITFYTETGKYEYRAWAEPLGEQLYCDDNRTIILTPRYTFLQAVVDTAPSIGIFGNVYKETWVKAAIYRIEIFEKEVK